MNRLLTFATLTALPLFAGCINISKTAAHTPSAAAATHFASFTTPQLEARRADLTTEIARIEREVELKAGLHMGVFIGDERGRLAELYREAGSIDSELLRRSSYSKL